MFTVAPIVYMIILPFSEIYFSNRHKLNYTRKQKLKQGVRLGVRFVRLERTGSDEGQGVGIIRMGISGAGNGGVDNNFSVPGGKWSSGGV